MLGAHGGDKHNSCIMHGTNSSELGIQQNLRVVRSPEAEHGTKLMPSSSLLQVGSPIVGNTPVNARLADYLRSAPRRWPVERSGSAGFFSLLVWKRGKGGSQGGAT